MTAKELLAAVGAAPSHCWHVEAVGELVSAIGHPSGTRCPTDDAVPSSEVAALMRVREAIVEASAWLRMGPAREGDFLDPSDSTTKRAIQQLDIAREAMGKAGIWP